jgi:spore coat protein CotF
MTAQLGAHEVMEIHEVLSHAIDSINQFQLYRPYVRDQQLGAILDKQLQFMTQEYNGMVQALHQNGMGQGIQYRAPKNIQPQYGLRQPQPQSPNTSPNQLDDRDVASGMLGAHKSSAVMKMMASLECTNPNLRGMLQQGAINCSEMAYETWQYMNQKGYYQVPTMKEQTTQTMMNAYTTGNMMNMGNIGDLGNVGFREQVMQAPYIRM